MRDYCLIIISSNSCRSTGLKTTADACSWERVLTSGVSNRFLIRRQIGGGGMIWFNVGFRLPFVSAMTTGENHIPE
jgi:hypothetical protein